MKPKFKPGDVIMYSVYCCKPIILRIFKVDVKSNHYYYSFPPENEFSSYEYSNIIEVIDKNGILLDELGQILYGQK